MTTWAPFTHRPQNERIWRTTTPLTPFDPRALAPGCDEVWLEIGFGAGEHLAGQAASGYVDGYPQMNQGGLSEVMVDNSHNGTDVFAKLVSLDGPTAFPVRSFFVAAHSRFTLAGLATGTYDLRYRNLASGGLLRSPAFILEEVSTARGTQHSVTTVKLHQAADGSLQTYSLGDAEF